MVERMGGLLGKRGIASGWLLVTAVGLVVGVVIGPQIWGNAPAAAPTWAESFAKAKQLIEDGNFADAYRILQPLVVDPQADPRLIGSAIHEAVDCLQRLARTEEVDGLLESVAASQKHNWRALEAVAEDYFRIPHFGFMIAGQFQRGHHRGGGEFVNSFERDRVRALQLMHQAMPLATAEQTSRADVGQFFLRFATYLLGNRLERGAWRLQALTDLSTLPDYEPGWQAIDSPRGAPVDSEGNPIFYNVPANWEAAQNDGERWRWCLIQAAEWNASLLHETRLEWADFLRSQFGVETLAELGWFRLDEDESALDRSAAIFALHTLSDDETIARLATGVRRFSLPEEFNPVRIYQQVAQEAQGDLKARAWRSLAEIFENRRQFPRAAEYWRKLSTGFSPAQTQEAKHRLQQIEGNWGRFEPVLTQPAGRGATIDFRFRNGREVEFTAHEIRVAELLSDVKAYLKSNPQRLSHDRFMVENLGYLLVQQNQRRYLGPEVARWRLGLEPRPQHFDRRITVSTPLQKPGAYFLTAKMTGGNTSHVVVWIADTAIVQKPLDRRTWYYVGDAITGAPVARANVEFFGFRQKHLGGNRFDVEVRQFAHWTDENGQVALTRSEMSEEYQWLVIARGPRERFAYLGFRGVWFTERYDPQYEATKVFAITDRPVYRPGQTVHYKLWVRHAKYDLQDTSEFAGRSFVVEVYDPRGERIVSESKTADAFGGLLGQYELPADATLGVYSVQVKDLGGGSFRVEEYKKPEFEVLVEAPPEPVRLGEKVTAKVKANYYFGAPVTQAKVKYKVLRHSFTGRWYPPAPWDWLYGPGYWWFAYDYAWYPGWRLWGCPRPSPVWWHIGVTPPELVAEQEVPIGEDGTVSITLDTASALALHPDQDHRYEITAEVTDQSRRTIVGTGQVLVARKPFQVYVWVDRGYLRAGETFSVSTQARRLDGQPVEGEGTLRLMRIRYPEGKPVEQLVHEQPLNTDATGRASCQLRAGEPGQFRVSVSLSDRQGHTIEGGYVFSVVGPELERAEFEFNELELVPDRREYQPGQTVQLQVNTRQADSTVLLFLRPTNGVYLPPQVIRLRGKTAIVPIPVTTRDMPNFFVEAMTIGGARVHVEVRQIAVPPEKRVLNVELLPSKTAYRPGEAAKVQMRLTDFHGRPFVGSMVVAIYDKALEYISGGSNVPEIREFFWRWQRHHRPHSTTNLDRVEPNWVPPKTMGMADLGLFGGELGPERLRASRARAGATDRLFFGRNQAPGGLGGGVAAGLNGAPARPMAAAPAMEAAADASTVEEKQAALPGAPAPDGGPGSLVQPMIRTAFADTALWVGNLETQSDGTAEVSLQMPENLTTWRVCAWAMGHGTKVGEAQTEVITRKDLIIRLQAPRFFIERDEVVLSANVHNYLTRSKQVQVSLELEGDALRPLVPPELATESYLTRTVEVGSGGEVRVDWRVAVTAEGTATVRMKALTDEESDAMQLQLPCYVHGMLKMDSYCGVLRPEEEQAQITVRVPEERRPEQTRLEVRWSPTLAGALVDALPYLVDYPYGCTEQTLNRFLPTVIVQRVLIDMGIDLEEVRRKQVNLNPQELGPATERARQWQRYQRNPVFDRAEVDRMVRAGVQALTEMQLSDGGWGWFSGYGEHSSPHMTAYVVHGLQVAHQNDVAIVPEVLERGVAWLKTYQEEQLRRLENGEKKPPVKPWKSHADNLDAFVYMVLVDSGIDEPRMREYLYRDRLKLSAYCLAMLGLAVEKLGDKPKLEMILQNLRQYVQQDDENQTAWLRLPEGSWWYWYGSQFEAQAYYLKLLARTDPRGELARRLVKYLLNNRKHATYWNSTRDTALCIEAMAEFLRASGEAKPEMTVEILVDGQLQKAVEITPQNLFAFDGALVIEGEGLGSGEHKIELRRRGRGPLYFNAYLTTFSLEDYIPKAGLEIKVDRRYYRLKPVEATVQAAGSRGQLVQQRVEKYEREPLSDLAILKSGDLVEVELEIESKNDYEYLVFEDMKPAGFEPVDLRSGYTGNPLGAYVEFRDNRVVFFTRWLAQGRHSVAYRLRAEIPGRFSALPTRAAAMYAPELRANSSEIKLNIVD